MQENFIFFVLCTTNLFADSQTESEYKNQIARKIETKHLYNYVCLVENLLVYRIFLNAIRIRLSFEYINRSYDAYVLIEQKSFRS